MQEIAVYDLDGNTLTNLVQYDTDVYIHIQDPRITDAYQVQFFNPTSESALVMDSTYSNGVLSVKIPNDLLLQPYTITGYVNVKKSGESKCLYAFRIAVRKKPKPSDWVYVDSKDYVTFEQIVAECRKFAENASTSETNAKASEIAASNSATNARTSETNAKASADAAKISETNSKASENAAKISETNAKDSETNSKSSEEASKQSEINAKESEENAKGSEENAKDRMVVAFNSALLAKSYTTGDSADVLADGEWSGIIAGLDGYTPPEIRENESTDNAKYYKEQAGISANTATTQATIATTQATDAKTSADSAKSSEDAAKGYKDATEGYATLARSYTVGDTDTRENEAVNNAKYYYEQSKRISEGLNGALLPMGTISFSQLSIQTKSAGYMYNISDDFVSDNTFKDGGNISYPAGTNVYYTADGYWDCLSASLLYGVKGNAEATYRKGFVNITPENIGTYSKAEVDGLIGNINGTINTVVNNTVKSLQDTITALTERITALENIIELGDINIVTKIVDNDGNGIVTNDGDILLINRGNCTNGCDCICPIG